MKDKQEIWTMMIISAFAKKQGLSIAATTKLLLENGGIDYLADCYGTLHLLSNDDVTEELIQMTGSGGVRCKSNSETAMTDKQRFLVYVHLGQVLGNIMRESGLPMTEALQEMSNSQFIEKLENLETGHYLESSAYLCEEYKKLSLTPV